MGKRWSRRDEVYLIEALRKGESKLSIASVLGRSFDAVLSRVKVITAREKKLDYGQEDEGDGQDRDGGRGR